MQKQLKQLQQELKEKVEELGLKEIDSCINSWKSDVLLVAKGLWLFSSLSVRAWLYIYSFTVIDPNNNAKR